ncbi:glycosyltransferase family 4 protein [Neptunomonas japonica]|uniref:N-acetyl-alpha-D-glucosaminyl L-malate synthase n=1 Tax=Neptunomonas japonica JAMM 1380 TaxID=1441457 RepID=A0A7R6PIG6_9GAMM|nr:glycosyltransferase [Neptunomonas japonica]BBB28871.1 N-acetyl-alpha-D-glucosaminyl L-malate synthase [Neptunomonas japonica JAMM 1380]
MRKLLFVGQFPPPKHGVSIINELLCSELKSSYEVSKYDYRFSNDLKDIGGRLLSKLIVYIKHCFSLLRIIFFSDSLDVIYFTPNVRGGVFFRDLIVVLILKLSRAKIFLHLHGLGVADRSSSRVWRALYFVMFSRTYIVHVSKRVVLDEFKYHYGTKGRFYLNNSVDLSLPEQIASKKVDGFYGKTIVHMSNFRPSKGIMDVLKAYKELKKEMPCCLKMVGSFTSNDFEAEVFSYIHKEEIEDVEFLGFLETDEKNKVLAMADLFLYPSYDDSFGLVVLEAQVLGAPVVAYDIGSMKQIVNPKQGFVAELGDFYSLLSAGKKILNSDYKSIDWDFLKDYDIKNYTSRLVDILESSK